MQKKIFIFIIILFLFSSLVYAEGSGGLELGGGSYEDTGGLELGGGEYEETETTEVETPTEIEGAVETDEGVDITNTQGDTQVASTQPEQTIVTNQGPIADFSLQNSLFSAGNFIQGTLVSFTNANPLNFQSMFDSSLFTVTLNNEDQAEVAQTNGFGELGYTYISTTGGNITQDGTVIFIPEGDSPTYIYYNTTEVEFEDGTVYYFNEQLTNTDQTKEPSSLNFDTNGFTKVQIQPENNYTIGDYTFINKEEDPVWACKQDTSCQINIDTTTGIYTITGKTEFFSNQEIIINSFDTNNKFTFDETNNILNFENSNPQEEIQAYIYNGYHKIIEAETTYSQIIEHEYPSEFTVYNFYTIDNGVLIYGNIEIIPPEERDYPNIWTKVIDYKDGDKITGGFVGVEASENWLTWIFMWFA
ncbi:hypothetical protein HOC80_05185 [archaeon]|jgi:hypothetical protein|nr:hypothetical protein [archaeon]MBT4417466.1 hypothetical protein [archaeon]